MKGLKLTPDALNDLREIARYTQDQWGIEQRNLYLSEMDKRFQWLLKNTKLATKRDDIKSGYLSYPQGKHVIFFRIKDSDIEILAILHPHIDIKLHL